MWLLWNSLHDKRTYPVDKIDAAHICRCQRTLLLQVHTFAKKSSMQQDSRGCLCIICCISTRTLQHDVAYANKCTHCTALLLARVTVDDICAYRWDRRVMLHVSMCRNMQHLYKSISSCNVLKKKKSELSESRSVNSIWYTTEMYALPQPLIFTKPWFKKDNVFSIKFPF